MMKNPKIILLALIAAATVAMSGVAFAADKDGLVLEPGYFRPSFTFIAHYVANGIGAADVNFKDDLGLNNKNAPEYRLWLNDTLRLAYTKWDFSGGKTLPIDITWGGSTFPAGNTASSILKTDYYRLTWLHHITKSPVLQTDWLIDLKGFNFRAAISGTDTLGHVVTQSKDFTGVIPTVGLRVVTKLKGNSGLGVFGEITGIPAGKYGYFYDMEGGLKYYLNKQASVTMGYRAFDLYAKDGKADGDKVEFKQSGPFFTLAYKF